MNEKFREELKVEAADIRRQILQTVPLVKWASGKDLTDLTGYVARQAERLAEIAELLGED